MNELTSIATSAILALSTVLMGLPAVASDEVATSPNKVLFLGNSITLHGLLPAIEWPHNHGMAASAPEKDYVHFTGRPCANPGCRSGARNRRYSRSSIAARGRGSLPRSDAGGEKFVDFKADVVILAIGENVRPLSTAEDKARFKKAAGDLLTLLKHGGKQQILVRSSFWPIKAHDEILREACAEAHGVFVDLGTIGNDESNRASSEQKFNYLKYPGVGGHPGDKGMAAIADAIWKSWISIPR